jgi:hypothetical protein
MQNTFKSRILSFLLRAVSAGLVQELRRMPLLDLSDIGVANFKKIYIGTGIKNLRVSGNELRFLNIGGVCPRI